MSAGSALIVVYILGAIFMLMWFHGIVKMRRELKHINLIKREAAEHLSRAIRLSMIAAVEQPFAVCDSCKLIRSRYVRDEDGVTCIDCAAKHSEPE